MKTLYIAWRDSFEKAWIPVGKLIYDGEKYIFSYTQGALKSKNFVHFGRMKNFEEIYGANELFPLFANRLLSKSRPEYNKMLHWLQIDEDEDVDINMLALTEGIRTTDSLEIFPCPVNVNGRYNIKFFTHGLSHLPKKLQNEVKEIRSNDRLYLMLDVQNKFDDKAIALRTDDPLRLVGYCPRYLVEDFNELVNKCGHDDIVVTVVQANDDAPLQYRLLCELNSPWPDGFMPCSSMYYQDIKKNTCAVP